MLLSHTTGCSYFRHAFAQCGVPVCLHMLRYSSEIELMRLSLAHTPTENRYPHPRCCEDLSRIEWEIQHKLCLRCGHSNEVISPWTVAFVETMLWYCHTQMPSSHSVFNMATKDYTLQICSVSWATISFDHVSLFCHLHWNMHVPSRRYPMKLRQQMCQDGQR